MPDATFYLAQCHLRMNQASQARMDLIETLDRIREFETANPGNAAAESLRQRTEALLRGLASP